MSHIKIGIINNEFFRADLGGYGGFGSLVKYLSEYYNKENKKRKVEIDVILPRQHKEKEQIVHYARTHMLDVTLRPMYRYFEFFKRIRRLSSNYDAVLTIEWYNRYALPALAVDRSTNIVLWLQDPRSIYEWDTILSSPQIRKIQYDNKPKDVLLNSMRRTIAMQRMGLKIVEIVRRQQIRFATQAKFLRDRALQKYGRPSSKSATFLPNPVKIPTKKHLAQLRKQRDEFLKKHDISSDKITITFLGRLDPIKRPVLFFEIAKNLPNYEFIVAGIPHDKKMLPIIDKYRHRIANLHFLGLVTGDEKEELLASTDILINTSIHEALPVSFLEALAYEIPIISTQNPDCITSTFGIHVKNPKSDGFESVKDFTKAVTELAEDDNLRKTLGKRGRKYVEKNHSFERFEQQLKKITQN